MDQQTNRRPIRIGNGAGFWGDSLDAPFHLARDGRLDVLTLEYLAELTLAILSHLRSKDPNAGYVTDFPPLLQRLAPILAEQAGLKIVTNAGGLNTASCAAVCARIAAGNGLDDMPIGVVTGDDVLGRIASWRAEGVALDHLETGEPIERVADRLVCANVYLGARPIAEALGQGARIALTGRVADASLTVGPVVDRFGWSWDDWDRLAGASVAGHLIECGAQVTGGLWEGWEAMPDPAGIGYPIAEVAADGSTVVTKVEGTGGVVSRATVTEQIVYEIGDPSCYRTPDVDVDFTTVALDDQGPDRVLVRGASGRRPSDFLKLAAVYRDGWTASGMLAVVGRSAEAKARFAAGLALERVRRAGFTLEHSLVECFGAGDVAPGVFRPEKPAEEVLLRVTVRDPSRAAVERFCRELAPLITSGPPGLAGYATGRPTARPAFGYWPALVPRGLVDSQVEVRPSCDWVGREGDHVD
ncbi:MAG: DUF1446 domain-containing protein [Paludisphaera borealis]|uniref:acyclic terpene utilization AtuA family protein n=1 Tax=Paludisphaera borealis TaxID=1387353 RepID=UPI00283FB569|nr:acyclic terpene utilization AtuA family protein [Paludisphaera borealis]MDR3617752.1 DUF1446 domain-containing protein [Paludisphaera borealis]